MVPYLPAQEWHIGPLPIHLFGLLVAAGILLGSEICVRRAKKLGLDQQRMSTLVFWLILAGFVGAHLVQVVFYDWPALRERPWRLFQIWNGISSLGGFFGAFVAVYFFLKKMKLPLWPYMDTIAYALPFGWLFGRMGCFSAHDHPGRLSNFFLAVRYPNGASHDLGLYELLFTLLIVLFFLSQRNRRRPVGFYLTTLLLVYPPVRFALDFLRVADQTYFGLTFAQYALVPLFLLGLYNARRLWQTEPAR